MRSRAAQPLLLAWLALLPLSKYPDSAKRSVPALWPNCKLAAAGTVPLQYQICVAEARGGAGGSPSRRAAYKSKRPPADYGVFKSVSRD